MAIIEEKGREVAEATEFAQAQEVAHADKTSLGVVILVHGTFAGAKEDDGSCWWQRGSVFWND